jgi:hypothetical protein
MSDQKFPAEIAARLTRRQRELLLQLSGDETIEMLFESATERAVFNNLAFRMFPLVHRTTYTGPNKKRQFFYRVLPLGRRVQEAIVNG